MEVPLWAGRRRVGEPATDPDRNYRCAVMHPKYPEPSGAQIPPLFTFTYSTGVQNLIHRTKLVVLPNEI